MVESMFESAVGLSRFELGLDLLAIDSGGGGGGGGGYVSCNIASSLMAF